MHAHTHTHKRTHAHTHTRAQTRAHILETNTIDQFIVTRNYDWSKHGKAIVQELGNTRTKNEGTQFEAYVESKKLTIWT